MGNGKSKRWWALMLAVGLAGVNVWTGPARAGISVGPGVPAGNITGVVSGANGGLGFANTNWVPAGATYDNGAAWGYPQYTVPVLSNGLYYLYLPGNGASNDQAAIFLGDMSGYIANSGLFIPLTNHIQLYGNNPSTTVYAQIYLVDYTNGFHTNAIYGDFGGQFDGSVTSTSIVPDGALSQNVQLLSKPLFETATGGLEHRLISTNTTSGSTLSLIRVGTNGYADENFYTAPNLTQAFLSPTLEFAIGVGFAGNVNVAYRNPYIEMYHNDKSFYFVESTLIHGGAQRLATGLAPTWAWFQNGDTNQPLFRVDPASGTTTNYGQFVGKSNVTFLSSVIGLGTIALTNKSATQTMTQVVSNSTGVPMHVTLELDAEITTSATGSVAVQFTATNLSSGAYTWTPASINTASTGYTTFTPQVFILSNNTALTYTATLTGTGHYNLNGNVIRWQ